MSKVEGGGGGGCPIDSDPLPSRLRVTILSLRLLRLERRSVPFYVFQVDFNKTHGKKMQSLLETEYIVISSESKRLLTVNDGNQCITYMNVK